jgi:hypothetical protein
LQIRKLTDERHVIVRRGRFCRGRKRMKRNALALILLAALGFGLLAVPCSGRHGAGKEKSPHSSPCHGMQAEPGASSRASDPSPEPSNGCDASCRNACHMSAIAEVVPVSFVIAPVAQTAAEAPDPGLPLFAHAIDHVPLA